jgi:hypothetical protein
LFADDVVKALESLSSKLSQKFMAATKKKLFSRKETTLEACAWLRRITCLYRYMEVKEFAFKADYNSSLEQAFSLDESESNEHVEDFVVCMLQYNFTDLSWGVCKAAETLNKGRMRFTPARSQNLSYIQCSFAA